MGLAVIPRLLHSFRPESAADPIRELFAAAVEQTAVEMLDPERILAPAEDMRVTQRKRVHHAGLTIDSLVLSALQRSTDSEGRWLDAQVGRRVAGQIGAASAGRTTLATVKGVFGSQDTQAGRIAGAEVRGDRIGEAVLLVAAGRRRGEGRAGSQAARVSAAGREGADATAFAAPLQPDVPSWTPRRQVPAGMVPPR